MLKKNGNTKWQDAAKLEIAQLNDYEVYKDLGKGAPIPDGYQKIPCHMVYDVKHDGRHKARFVVVAIERKHLQSLFILELCPCKAFDWSHSLLS